MTYLPVDYYILLQNGYKKAKSSGKPKRTNMVMFNNLPVLNKKATFLNKSTSIVKAITYEDVHRCLEKKDAKQMLVDTHAEKELKRLLEEYYEGKVTKLEFINYNPERIVQSFHAPNGKLSQDYLNEFNNFIQYGGKQTDTA
jgi:hypothetical protein